MLDRLGKRRYAMPIIAIIVIFCVFSLVMYPMMHAAPKNVPFAIVNLDSGAQGPTGEVNLGDAIVDNVSSGMELEEGQESPLAWTELSSQAELDEAMENNEFYGALVIPENFSSAQLAAQMATLPSGQTPALDSLTDEQKAMLAAAQSSGSAGALTDEQKAAPAAAAAQGQGSQEGLTDEQKAMLAAAQSSAAPEGLSDEQKAALAAAQSATANDSVPDDPTTQPPSSGATPQAVPADTEAPSVELIINQGKNAMLASTMQMSMTAMLGQTGMDVKLTTINSIDSDNGGMAAMMSGMVMVMPTFIMTVLGSVLLYLIFRPAKGANRSEKFKAFGKQLAYATIVSLLASCAAVLMVGWVGGMDVPAGSLILFLWLASFCLMTLFIGALDIALPLGALVILTCFACGMSSGMLAPEMLPDFWRDWIYPWVPQHYIGEGISAVIYRGQNVWNAASGPLVIMGCVGLALGLTAGLIPSKGEKKDR